MLDDNIQIFLLYIKVLNLLLIHTAWKAQILLLIVKKVEILNKYSDFPDVF